MQQFGHVAACDFLCQPLGDRRLADSRFTDQDRIVFRPSAKHLNDAFDFIVPANHRIEFAFLGQISEITAKGAERGRLDVLSCWFAAFLVRFGRCEVWIELL